MVDRGCGLPLSRQCAPLGVSRSSQLLRAAGAEHGEPGAHAPPPRRAASRASVLRQPADGPASAPRGRAGGIPGDALWCPGSSRMACEARRSAHGPRRRPVRRPVGRADAQGVVGRRRGDRFAQEPSRVRFHAAVGALAVGQPQAQTRPRGPRHRPTAAPAAVRQPLRGARPGQGLAREASRRTAAHPDVGDRHEWHRDGLGDTSPSMREAGSAYRAALLRLKGQMVTPASLHEKVREVIVERMSVVVVIIPPPPEPDPFSLWDWLHVLWSWGIPIVIVD